MASLTHVCMWSDNSWKPVTAEQAAKLHPGGTVSAHSGLFMCELCGQYVTLTDGDIVKRYFKHSAHEKSKNCPERTFGAGYSISYSSQEHDLPIRITSVSSPSFSFEVGLIRAPISSLNKDFIIEIKPKGISDILPCVFTKERLNYDSITYLPIGEEPFEKYTLSFQNGNDKLHDFWPAEIAGIDPDGTLFEKASGKKLPYDADVEIEKEYYLLKCGRIYSKSYSSMRIQEIVQKRIGGRTWFLYVVSASAFDEDAARFYLNFHCRLTEHPVSLQPVWPLFVEGNYIVKHNQNSMYMIVEGNVAEVKTFPSVTISQLNNISQPKLYEVFCSDRQQLISVGRTQALQYTYFWKEQLDQTGLKPKVSVTDLSGAEVNAGEADILPPNKTLRFKSIFDGELIVFNNNHVVDKRKISADKYTELDGLFYGLSVQVVIGLDVIWEISFKKQQPIVARNEIEILKRITDVSGAIIPAPHSLQNILVGMSRYPQICQWIRKCIKNGIIHEQSYRKLQMAYRNINTNG